jgi:hypothetical protein
MRAIVTLFTAALIHAGAIAQVDDPEQQRKVLEQMPVNTFRVIGNQLVCKQDKPVANYNACLKIGQIRIGDSYPDLRERYPKPWKEVLQDGGVTATVFVIAATKEARAYWVIGHGDGKIVAIQLTGNYAHPDFAFSTIQLNDSEEKVIALLGEQRQITPVKEIDGVMWDYQPFPISVQFVHGRVYSIKVTAPAGDTVPQGSAPDGKRP